MNIWQHLDTHWHVTLYVPFGGVDRHCIESDVPISGQEANARAYCELTPGDHPEGGYIRPQGGSDA